MEWLLNLMLGWLDIDIEFCLNIPYWLYEWQKHVSVNFFPGKVIILWINNLFHTSSDHS